MPFTPFDLTGKAALVSGGNGGIGLGMAEGLAAAGADVAIWGMNPAKNAAAEERLLTYGGRVFVEQVDVRDEQAVADGMTRAIAEFGRLDFVAANAGVSGDKSAFVDTTTEAWNRVMQVNLHGVFWTLREACKHMAARAVAGDPGGSLLAVSSTSAIHGAARNQAYGSAKGALLSLVRAIAVEHARHGIRANALLPGWTRSDLTEGLQQWDTFNEKAIGRVPLKRWGEPEDFSAIAVYLASNASRFHTGDCIVIDGGYTVY